MRVHVKHGSISKTKVFVIGHRLISCFPEAPAEQPSEATSELGSDEGSRIVQLRKMSPPKRAEADRISVRYSLSLNGQKNI